MKRDKWSIGGVLVLAITALLAFPVLAGERMDADVTEGTAEYAEEEMYGGIRTFSEESVSVTGITLNQQSAALHVKGQTLQLAATVTPADATDPSVIWSSDNTSAATVDKSSGLVTVVGNGTAKITATSAENAAVSASCTVTVSLYDGIYEGYYYKKGVKDTSTTDVKKINGTWYNLVKGKVVGNTVAKNSNGWWYIDRNGKVDFSYTGFAENKNGKWYCENGKVTFQTKDILKDETGALGQKGAWYYVIGSKVQTSFTGLSNFSNKNGWWYIKNGKVDFSHNGVDKNVNGWWYVENGKVDFSHNGVDKNKNGWWYVVGGKVQFGYTGLANYKNANGWWYIKNGKVDFSYTGVAKNKNGWWYVNGGKVIFDDCLTEAARYVGAHTSTSQSNSEKLKTMCNYMRSHYNYIRTYGTSAPASSEFSSLALDWFSKKGGNCYRYALATTCIAKVLGFDTRTVLGAVSNSNGIGTARHGWCEVYVDGSWYVCDVNFGIYMKPRSQHVRKLTVDNVYRLNIVNGKAVWQ